ncbi:hypothetical protein [Paenibacillus lutrae]|uniref:Copper amine oxidase-like N-terminal domain-containing protein n=1 Tax=Paenibacillus lutrae TaxID=2078573 RepID=A0A7X3FKA0_9BACL|nr:hypothetical protein [Paenibacillus lutrae]MVP01280.1 hypothetical protein [Paenibacillus lutrae]
MKKSFKRLSVTTVLALFISLFASFTGLAASEEGRVMRFDSKLGGYVTISNVVELTMIEDVSYGEVKYLATGPVKVTFYGELSEETAIAKWVDDESLEYVDIVNNSAVLTEAVDYGIFPVFQGENKDDNAPILLQVIGGEAGTEVPGTEVPGTEEPMSETVSAIPTPAKVLVNGKDVAFEAYNIQGNNYFKLRDLAISVNGTEKNFEISWDADKNAIALAPNKAYTPVGGELAAAEGSASKEVQETSASVYLDELEVFFIAYNIDGNNYFKLRDVAELMNIGVTWDADANSIRIDTKDDYKAE